MGFAFELYDMDGSGVVKKAEMNFVLRCVNQRLQYPFTQTNEILISYLLFLVSQSPASRSMNDTASYFGDPVMTQDQIAILVDEVYEKFDEDEAAAGVLGLAWHVRQKDGRQLEIRTGGGTLRLDP